MLHKVFKSITSDRLTEKRARLYREIITREAEIGGKLFGPVKPNGRREFFCLNEDTWIWHEEWLDEKGVRQVVTTRYDIRPNGIFKAQDNQPYQQLGSIEDANFRKAVHLYNKNVDAELYGIVA